MNFGTVLSELRTHFKLSQEDLAEKCGVSRQTVRRWEYEESLPDIYELKLLCAIFSVPPEYFMGETASAPPASFPPSPAAPNSNSLASNSLPSEPSEAPAARKTKGRGSLAELILWAIAAVLGLAGCIISAAWHRGVEPCFTFVFFLLVLSAVRLVWLIVRRLRKK